MPRKTEAEIIAAIEQDLERRRLKARAKQVQEQKDIVAKIDKQKEKISKAEAEILKLEEELAALVEGGPDDSTATG